MSMYLFTKNLRLRAMVNHQLENPCICIISMEQLEKSHGSISLDRYPVLLIDEDFAGERLVFFLSWLISYQIKGPKIFLFSPDWQKTTHSIFRERHLLFLPKPFTQEQLQNAILTVSGMFPLIPHLSKEGITEILQKHEQEDHYDSILIGKSAAIQNIRRIIWGIGQEFSSIHINGATGTGKEVVAQLLYLRSSTMKPMVIANCALLSGNLLDTQLFGQVRGAFTDAKEDREGLVKKADHSILFLDEIQALDPVVQGKFLRLLEYGTFRPVGSDEIVVSDFKTITASNIPLERLLDGGQLREDLYNRINRISIDIPPLKERKEDIPLLIDHYLSKRSESRKPDQKTMDLFMGYDWPGNVRELFVKLDTIITFAGNQGYLSVDNVLTDLHLKQKTPPRPIARLPVDNSISAERSAYYPSEKARETCG